MEKFDVVIVGMGPVGASAALMLADAGLSVAAIERDIEVYPLPRAVGMDGEIVRAFQAIGREEDIARLLQPVRKGSRAGFVNSRHEWLFGQDMVTQGPSGWPPLSMFDQPELDSFLRKACEAHAGISCFLGYEVTAIEQDADQAIATATHIHTSEEIRCSGAYLIGCDGAASFARRAIGSSWRDLGYDQDWLVVDITVKPGHTLTDDVWQVCDPDRILTYVATKDPYRRWEFRLNPGETREEMLKEETIHALIEPWTPAGTYELRRSAVYQFHACVTEKWREGRVLLAGDAAHQTPPFLGQGMNSGIRDAINLAWKLPMVLSGDAPASLLDSYYAERMAHSEDLIDWAVGLGKLMEHIAAVEAATRGGPPPGEQPPLSAGYGQGRMIPPLRQGILCADQVSDDGSTGHQLRQPLVESAAGVQSRFDELLGSGFAVVARNHDDLQFSEESRATLEQLGAALVVLEDYSTVAGQFDAVFDDAAAVIVRPDRYIFGHTDKDRSLDGLVAELAADIGLLVTA